MSERTVKAEEMNRAIVNKLERILSNTDFINELDITIKGNRGSVPVIRYNIEELIVPERKE